MSDVYASVAICCSCGFAHMKKPTSCDCGNDESLDGFEPGVIVTSDDYTTLRQQLAESKEREATSFYQGVCTTLAMIDPHSTEYHESVLQHGGYHVLWEVASDYDKEHLLAAAKANYGGGYEVWLSQESGQPSKQEGSGNE